MFFNSPNFCLLGDFLFDFEDYFIFGKGDNLRKLGDFYTELFLILIFDFGDLLEFLNTFLFVDKDLSLFLTVN